MFTKTQALVAGLGSLAIGAGLAVTGAVIGNAALADTGKMIAFAALGFLFPAYRSGV